MLNELSYFSADYTRARRRFLDEAQRLAKAWPSADLQSFHVPSQTDDDLFVDSIYLPARQKRRALVTLVSGVHGMEAYAGSAIQQMVFAELMPALKPDVGLLMVHVMNPFGFKHHRRGTEGNVNLNRNFALSENLFKNSNEGYRKIHDFLAPKRQAPLPIRGFARHSFRIGANLLARRYTLAELNQWIGLGQFEFQDGLEFGGFGFEPQTIHFRERLGAAMTGYPEFVLMDLHTGLGDRYELHLIPGDNPKCVDPDLYARVLPPDGPEHAVYEFTPFTAEGFYRTFGDLNDMVADMLSPQQKAVALTMEFGTLGNRPIHKLQVINRLILENQGYFHGFTSSVAEREVKRAFADLFYPEDPQWRRNLIDRSRRVLSAVLTRL